MSVADLGRGATKKRTLARGRLKARKWGTLGRVEIALAEKTLRETAKS